MTDMIPVITGEIVSTDYPEDKIQDFLDSLDVAEKSRATYERSLRQFILWLYESSFLLFLNYQRILQDLKNYPALY